MKPASIKHVQIYIPHIYTLSLFQVPEVALCDKKANRDLNVSLARLFIHTMRWILIIAASVTCLDMSGDLQQKSQIFHFCHPWYDRGCFLFSVQGCELRRVNNQQIKSRNSSNNVKQVTRTTNKEVEMSSLRILTELKLLTLQPVGFETTRSVVFSWDNKSETNLLKSQLESWHLNLPNTQQRKRRDEGQKPRKTVAVGLERGLTGLSLWMSQLIPATNSWGERPSWKSAAIHKTKPKRGRDRKKNRRWRKEWEKKTRPEQEVCVRLFRTDLTCCLHWCHWQTAEQKYS